MKTVKPSTQARLVVLVVTGCAIGCAHGGEPVAPLVDDGALHVGDTGVDDVGFADGCGLIDLPFHRRTPSVLLLVDNSGSMAAPLGTSTRLGVVRDALVGTDGVVGHLEHEMLIGATLFASKDGFGGGTCPVLSSTAIALGGSVPIRALLDAAIPDGSTPTGESIEVVAAKLAALPATGPKYIVLATDGEPDTCATPGPKTGQPQALSAVQVAFSRDIGTLVLSVGEDASLEHLQNMANAGAGLPVGGAEKARYFLARDQAAVNTAFRDLVYGVRSCTFSLDGKVSRPAAGTITLDGAPLAYGGPDGFRLDPGGSELELLGAACAELKTGDHDLRVLFPCDVILR